MSRTEFQARPTLYKGIQMRSRLEADFAARLDQSGIPWEYEPVCFAGPDGQWLPDFRLLDDGKRIYVEVKPDSLPYGGVDPILKQMSVAWLSEPDACLHLVVWSYRQPGQGRSVVGIPRETETDPIWWHSEGTGELQMWPGMGQMEQVLRRMPLDELKQWLEARRVA